MQPITRGLVVVHARVWCETSWDPYPAGCLLDTGVAGTTLRPLPTRSYAPGVTYGEMFYQNEYEMSCYNLDEADVAGQRARCEGIGGHAGWLQSSKGC